jgi:hypothetical protein
MYKFVLKDGRIKKPTNNPKSRQRSYAENASLLRVAGLLLVEITGGDQYTGAALKTSL